MRASDFWQRMPKWQPPQPEQTTARALADLDRAELSDAVALLACIADCGRSLAARRVASSRLSAVHGVRHG